MVNQTSIGAAKVFSLCPTKGRNGNMDRYWTLLPHSLSTTKSRKSSG